MCMHWVPHNGPGHSFAMRSSLKKKVRDCPARIADNQIRSDALATIRLSSAKVTPSVLTKILSEKYRLAGKQIKSIIRIEISGHPLETIRRRFRMVTANLRYPSLKQLRSQLSLLTASCGALVISGIRNIELDDLLQFYAEKQWVCRWRQTEAGWAAAVLQPTDQKRNFSHALT